MTKPTRTAAELAGCGDARARRTGMNYTQQTDHTTRLTPNERGLTKREYMATALTAAIISGAVARGCPSNEWWDAPAEGAQLADKLLRVLAHANEDGAHVDTAITLTERLDLAIEERGHEMVLAERAR